MNIVTSLVDSPSGVSRYSEWRPPHLTGAVDLIWHFAGPSPNRYKRVLPTGRLELLVNLSDAYRIVEGAGTSVLRAAWIGGLLTRPQVIEQPPYQNVLGVRMHPTAAHSLLGVPMYEITGFQVALDELLGRASHELAECCAEAQTVRELMLRAEKWVRQRVLDAPNRDRAVLWSASQIEEHGGNLPIAILREHTGLSKTRLATRFRDHIGVTPKLYARLIRFRRAASLLQQGACSLVDVALEAGFYDQPHMNTEFRELGGLTPLDFIAARHPIGDGTTTRATFDCLETVECRESTV